MSKSKVLVAVHEMALDSHEAGVIDNITMKEFDVLCLPPVKEYTPLEIQRLRQRKLHCSQEVLAMYLNTNKSSVQKWERGARKPSGPVMRLLNLLETKGLEAIIA